MKKSLQICVKKCPDHQLNDMNDVCKFYDTTKSQLCHDKPGSGFSACKDPYRGSRKNTTGSCPVFPVYDSKPILNRCIPKAVTEVTKSIASNLYGVLNSWDTIEQVLGDLYKTWREILALSFLAFGMLLLLLHYYYLLFQEYLCFMNKCFFYSFVTFHYRYFPLTGQCCHLDCYDISHDHLHW